MAEVHAAVLATADELLLAAEVAASTLAHVLHWAQPVALDLPPLAVLCLLLVQESEKIRYKRVMTASQASA